jgi:IclR family transcriptional regulator, KDG regulon repressor
MQLKKVDNLKLVYYKWNVNTTKSVLKALDILELFWNGGMDSGLGSPDEMSLAQIAKVTKIDKSTANRLALTLVERGYLKQSRRRGKYSLGLIFLEFSGIVKTKLHIRNIALPYLNKLSLDLKESVNLTVWEKKIGAITETFRVIKRTEGLPESILSKEVPPEGMPEEMVIPLYCTSTGKIILASMSEEETYTYCNGNQLKRYTTNTITDFDVLKNQLMIVKQTGVAYDDEEYIPGVVGVASGLKDHEGRIVGAISVLGHPARLNHNALESMAPSVKACALKISKKLGYISLSPYRLSSF